MIHIKKHLPRVGWVLLGLTLLVSLLVGLYDEYVICKDFNDKFIDPRTKPIQEGTVALEHAFYEHYNARIMRCQDVESDIYVSYSLIILSIAFIVGGYIIREEGIIEEIKPEKTVINSRNKKKNKVVKK